MLPLFIANLKMLVRNREALFWALVFPILFIVVFGLFDMESMGTAKVAIVDQAENTLSQQLVESLGAFDFLEIDPELTQEAPARQALRDGDVSFVLFIPEGLRALEPGNTGRQEPVVLTLLFDEARIQQNQVVATVLGRFLDDVNLQLAGASRVISLESEGLFSRRIDYFDFIVPGIMGMGVMIFSVTFLATSVAQYREQKILKRMLATPLRVHKFLIAQVMAHLLLSLAQATIILGFGVVVFGAHVYGNYLWLMVLLVLANIIFLNIGFIVAGLTRSVSAASGLSNVIAMPLMFFSGTFFPTESLPPLMSRAVQYLPLTPLLDALRLVALQAEPIWAAGTELALLGGWIVLTSLVAVRVFKFG